MKPKLGSGKRFEAIAIPPRVRVEAKLADPKLVAFTDDECYRRAEEEKRIKERAPKWSDYWGPWNPSYHAPVPSRTEGYLESCRQFESAHRDWQRLYNRTDEPLWRS